MHGFLHVILALVAFWLISGTLLNFSKHPHWYIRGWDFPRVFTAVISAALLAVYAIFFRSGPWWNGAVMAGLVFVIGRQLYMIYPYTPIAAKKVKQTTRPPGDHRFRLVMSNVLQENEEHDKWLKVVRDSDPDVIAAVEVDAKWDAALAALAKDYPHHVRQPQDNYYGMVLYSRLPFEGKPKVRFMVQDDIPSIHATLRLKDGQKIRLHAMHPRPPEPIRNQDSAPRDAELVLIGKEIAAEERHVPTVVCGDLNDVAWSYTTQLFLRLSKLLDPRMGRGMYNSYSANSRIFRFPLDHVFHSNEFKLVDLRVCEHVGSDHFPMLIELSCDPEAPAEQPEPETKAEDHEDAHEIVQEQAEREQTGEEHGHVSQGAGRG